MPVLRHLALAVALSLGLIAAAGAQHPVAAAPADAAPPSLHWPGTEAAAHARAWFAAYNDGEAAMRTLYQEHYSPDVVAARPIEARLERYREMRDVEGTLTPVAIPEVNEDGIQVVARTADGRTLTLDFECEPESPHRIRGIRVTAGGDGEDGGPGSGPGPGRVVIGGQGDGPGGRMGAATSGPPLSDEAAVQAMREIVARAAKADSFSGAVLLARDGKPLLRAAWNLAERRAGTLNRPETRFNLGSINKLFTKVAIAQLAQQGKLSLDDKLTRWIPDWPGASASKITLSMLAGHRAGIGDIFGARYDATDRSKLRHNRDFIPLFRDQPLWFEPGTSERYSNGSYVLLGEIIARASGKDYYDYMRDHVWGPAGMTATGYFAAEDSAPDVAMGYTRGEDGRGELGDNASSRPARGSAAGGGYSTLDDMLRFDQALIANKLCAPGWTAWVIGGPPPSSVQAATADGDDDRPAFGFAGGAPGISAEHTHEGALTLIVLGNLDPPFTQAVVRSLRPILRRMKD
jgi:CubicO group peptidase (beta-lactamase class C family)